MLFSSAKITEYRRIRAALLQAALFLLLIAADAQAEAPYPRDNDADYKNVPNWTSDNDGHYVPFVLRNPQGQRSPNAAPQPSPAPAQAYPPAYPADNNTGYRRGGEYPNNYQDRQEIPPAYPSDNDSDYEAPRPKGSDGDKNFYPQYYY